MPANKKKSAEKSVKTTDVEIQGVTGLPLRPYLDDIWAAINGTNSDVDGIESDITVLQGNISDVQNDIVDIQSDITDIQDNCCGGGGGDMALSAEQTVTGAKTFQDSTLLLRNVGNTFSAKFSNTISADRTYTLKDADGTLAFTTDITGTNSGVNTGDQTSIVGITGSLAEFNTALTGADFTTGGGTATGTNTGDQTSIVGITGTLSEFNTALTGADFATGGGTASGTNTGDNAVNSLYSGLVSNATHTGDATGSTALTVVGINNTILSGLTTGILKNTTATGIPSIAIAGDFPTLNQNTTGSAATLTTPRAIYGNNFDGSAALTQIIASTFGGTGNGFTRFSGPSSAEKTFTLPDASTTILTKNYTGGLATGILKNTTSSGDLSIAVAGDFPTLNQNTSGTANIAGGTAGAIPYQSSANTTTVLAATATADKILLSGANAAPTWSIPTFPNASATANKVIKSDGTNWVASTESLAAPGTSGNVLTSDGTNWTSAAPPTSLYSVVFNAASATGALVDAETIYLRVFGIEGTSGVINVSDARTRFYVHNSCVVKIARVFEVLSGTAGTNESWSWYIRVNGTTDTLIQTISSGSTGRIWLNTSMSVSLSSGDYFEVKSINPTWATNPNNVYSGVVWIQNS